MRKEYYISEVKNKLQGTMLAEEVSDHEVDLMTYQRAASMLDIPMSQLLESLVAKDLATIFLMAEDKLIVDRKNFSTLTARLHMNLFALEAAISWQMEQKAREAFKEKAIQKALKFNKEKDIKRTENKEEKECKKTNEPAH